jgi:hypothetical protein
VPEEEYETTEDEVVPLVMRESYAHNDNNSHNGAVEPSEV